MDEQQISVITTLYNEVETIDAFLDAISNQTRQPDEVVIVDAGSTDGTIERLRDAASADPRIKVIVETGNRSHGRNTAIENATNPIVACTDGGGRPDPEWLERICEPFSDGAQWVAGFYRVEADTAIKRCVGLTIVYVLEEVDPDLFLPSARSMAMTVQAWRAAGGFDESAEFGEDTLFDVKMLEAGYKPVFVPEAVVAWHPPEGVRSLARTAFLWGRGDGAAGLRGGYYKRTLTAHISLSLLVLLLIFTKPLLLPLTLIPVAYEIWRSIRFKLLHEESPLRYVYLTVARLVATSSNLAGFLVGRYLGE